MLGKSNAQTVKDDMLKDFFQSLLASLKPVEKVVLHLRHKKRLLTERDK